ncbi:MAG: multicopper oxidase domain-containing protein [Lautropia sp.]|nr:multicopper oxidase domain-containing protein [Lautropia sp.]
MRGYHESSLLVGRTIEAWPGYSLQVRLNNLLPREPGCPDDPPNPDGHAGHAHGDHDHNTPSCFNRTNLHTHGLWVSPSENADNVFVEISPGHTFHYRIDLPRDHPAGTFWYHSHVHGSTALQVSSGMAGALIVKGERQPSHTQPGDIDTLIKDTATQDVDEKVLVFQQILYACRDADGQIKKNADGSWRCDAGDVGELDRYDDMLAFGLWPQSGRLTTINGTTVPKFTAIAGRLERWRMIHAGVRESINLEFRRAADITYDGGFGHDTQRMSASQMDHIITRLCTGKPLPQHLMAADGLTMDAMQASTQTVFQPGYRWDAMMVFPQAGYYCVVDNTLPPSGSVDNVSARQLLGIVEVRPGTEVAEDGITEHLKERLTDLARKNVAADMRDAVIADLQASLGISRYAPHKSLANETMTGPGQVITFNVSQTAGGPQQFEVNAKPYDPNAERLLRLGDTEEWTLRSNRFGHPFHIHVNPFQIISIQDRHGRELSGFDTPDDDNGALPVDPQFRGLKNVWKDTLFVKSAPRDDLSAGQYQIRIRTRYQQFAGKFVLHCHILDHEDRGMMENVRIVGPNEPPAESRPPVITPVRPIITPPGIPLPQLPAT